ncbi:hypothetical protein L9F63_003460, partial [Diploptera punctata]
NIRRRVVISFRNAIDFEQQNNDVEAYRNYLEGLALVAATLQQDAESSWTLGNPSLTAKERRSLLGFAKQSVDRLMLLLDKQDNGCCNVFKETLQVTDNEAAKQNYETPVRRISTPSPQRGAVGREERPFIAGYEESPIARMQQENKLLIARYSTRLQAASTAAQRQNLQLELERRLTENAAIARQHQEMWEQRRSEVAARCHKAAEMKFQINEKIENGTITEIDFKKQRVYAASLQYEEENPWLNKLKQDFLYQPQDEKMQRDIVTKILLDRIHPLGCLMCQMQYAVLDKVNPIITKHQSLLVKKSNIRYGNENCIDARHKILSSIDQGVCNLSMDDAEDFGIERKVSHGASEEDIAQEEKKAFQRHFHNIAVDIKQGIKILETIIIALFEQLNSEKGRSIVTEILHQMYFAPIKPYLIILLRLITQEEEMELEAVMLAKQDESDLVPVEDGVKRQVCAMLKHITSLHSPCQMLDGLVAALKILASITDENNHYKSLGADDLLPRLMTIVTACGLPSLPAEAMYMENFMPTDRALGEGGYSLTVLQSVMSCLQPHSG